MNLKELLHDPYIILLLVTLAFFALLYYAGGFKVIKKMAYDTTVNKATGDFSMKRLMMWFSFWIGMSICFVQAFKIKLHPVMEFDSNPNTPMWAALIPTLVALGATAGLLIGHLNSRKTADAAGNPLTPPYVEPVKPIKPPIDNDFDYPGADFLEEEDIAADKKDLG